MASIIQDLLFRARSAVMAITNKQKETSSSAAAPSAQRERDPHGETLREKASKKIHGEGANPSQLGDPISLKAENSDTVPTDGEQGSRQQQQPPRSDGGDSAAAGRGSRWSAGQGAGETTEEDVDAAANREKRTSKI